MGRFANLLSIPSDVNSAPSSAILVGSEADQQSKNKEQPRSGRSAEAIATGRLQNCARSRRQANSSGDSGWVRVATAVYACRARQITTSDEPGEQLRRSRRERPATTSARRTSVAFAARWTECRSKESYLEGVTSYLLTPTAVHPSP